MGESYAWWAYVHGYWVGGLLKLTPYVDLPLVWSLVLAESTAAHTFNLALMSARKEGT